MCLSVDLFVLVLLGVCLASGVCTLTFLILHLESLGPLFFEIFLLPHICFPFGTLIMHMLLHLIMSRRSLRWSSYVLFFFFFNYCQTFDWLLAWQYKEVNLFCPVKLGKQSKTAISVLWNSTKYIQQTGKHLFIKPLNFRQE